MRQRMTLYIGGKKADINSDALVLMNYTMEDLQNPSIVKNSYSQSIVLPSTDNNNKIFGDIYRSDRKTIAGGGVGTQFSAISKTSFEIIAEDGTMLESGYIKLDSIDKKGKDINYKITLYGGLGAFLYSLMYDEDGNKKSLADLDYGTDLTFAMTRDAVREAWRQQADVEYTSAKWSVINFAPCYNGIPQSGFQANKAFIPSSCAGILAETDVTKDGVTTTYKTRRGYVLATLSQEYDEWQTRDLRSYLQRPVVKVEKVIRAICDHLQNGGYNVTLDNDFFQYGNPYWDMTWLTLPMLSDIQVESENGTSAVLVSQGFSAMGDDVYIPIPLSDGNSAIGTEYDASLTFIPQMSATGQGQGTELLCAWEYPTQPSGKDGVRVVCLYQLLAYDANDRVVGGSKIAMATTYNVSTDGQSITFPSTYTPEGFVQLWRRLGTYNEDWSESGYQSSAVTGDAFVVGSDGIANLQEGGVDKTITLDIKASGVARMALRMTTLKGIFQQNTSAIYPSVDDIVVNSAYSNVNIQGIGNEAVVMDYNYHTNGTIRSGATITQDILLGGTASPADYLLSFCKVFGLHIVYNASDKSISILTRNNLYNNTIIDLSDAIDRDTMSVMPYILDTRWYEFGMKNAEGAFLEYYNGISNIPYGNRRVNTGYEFNADTTDVFKDIVIKGCADVLAQSKYYVNISKDGKVFPSPLLDGGSYQLWNNDGETTSVNIEQIGDNVDITYINDESRGSDFYLASKPQFCDKEGKGKDGENVLLLYDYSLVASALEDYCLSDDNSLMSLYNSGETCWLFAQSEVAGNADYCISDALPMPLFRRGKTSLQGNKLDVIYSLDFGLPKELGAYNVTIQEKSTIYNKMWKSYITDRYDVDSRVMTCKANLKSLGQVNVNMLRNIYYYDNALWVMNAIKNASINTDDLTEIELVKVKDKNNYLSGQNYLSPTIEIDESYIFARYGESKTFVVITNMVATSTLQVTTPSWLTATLNGTSLTLTASNNPTEEKRVGNVVISGVASDMSVVSTMMYVEQTGAYKLTITPSVQYVNSRDYREMTYDIQYEGSDTLVASTNETWVNVSIYNNTSLVVSANQSNETNGNRTATIVVTGLGVSKSVEFVQRVGISVNEYTPTLTSNVLQLTQYSPTFFNLTGASAYIGDVAMILEVVVYVPSGNDVPSHLSAVINAGNQGGTAYNMSYIGSYSATAIRYKADNAIPLSQLLDGVTTGVLRLDTIGGDTLAMNELYVNNLTE